GKDMNEGHVLALAAALEKHSAHPIAHAIAAGADKRGAKALEATGFASLTGKGVTGNVAGDAVAVGNAALMEAEGVAVNDNYAKLLAEESGRGKTAFYVAT